MRNKKTITFMLLILLTFLTAFSRENPFVVKNVEVNVIKTANILRYDIVLKNTKELQLYGKKAVDSPGHRLFNHGEVLNFAVRPGVALTSLMEMESKTKYVKMVIRGGGESGNSSADTEKTISLEYAIKKDVNYEEVRKSALDSTLLVLLGNKVIAEIPLNKNG
jgi:hypothetical protein